MRPSNLKNPPENVTLSPPGLPPGLLPEGPSSYTHVLPQGPGLPFAVDPTLSTSWEHVKSISRPIQILSPFLYPHPCRCHFLSP